jgi:cobalamin biosynthesis protein CobC
MKSAPVTIQAPKDNRPVSDPLQFHGGNLAIARARYPDAPDPWIDLSTGINPFSYPIPDVSAASWARLPEEFAVSLLENAAAEAYAVRRERAVVAAPGSQALIELLPRAFSARRVGIFGFTYAEHERVWRDAGCVVETVDHLSALEAYDIGIVVNPNNPDGRLVPTTDLLVLAEAMGRLGSRLIVDEAFVDVLFEGASLAPYLPDKGAIILRSFGKTYGLAGLRLGFAIAGREDEARLREALGLWAISGPAIEIGMTALRDHEWLKMTRERLIDKAARLDLWLHKQGLTVKGGTPLYRFVVTDDARRQFERFAKAGVLVRAFRDQPHWLRIGLPAERHGWDVLHARFG